MIPYRRQTWSALLLLSIRTAPAIDVGALADRLEAETAVLTSRCSYLYTIRQESHSDTLALGGRYNRATHLFVRAGDRHLFAFEFSAWGDDRDAIDSRRADNLKVMAFDGEVLRVSQFNSLYLANFHPERPAALDSLQALDELLTVPVNVPDRRLRPDGTIMPGMGGSCDGNFCEDALLQGMAFLCGGYSEPRPWPGILRNGTARVDKEAGSLVTVTGSVLPPSFFEQQLRLSPAAAREMAARNVYSVTIDLARSSRIVEVSHTISGKLRSSLTDVRLARDSDSGIWYPTKFVITTPAISTTWFSLKEFSATPAPPGRFTSIWMDEQKILDQRDGTESYHLEKPPEEYNEDHHLPQDERMQQLTKEMFGRGLEQARLERGPQRSNGADRGTTAPTLDQSSGGKALSPAPGREREDPGRPRPGMAALCIAVVLGGLLALFRRANRGQADSPP